MGGFLNQNQRNGLNFKGLGDSQLLTTQFIKAHFNYQYEIGRNVFLTPHINFGLVGFGKFEDFVDEINLSNSHWSNLEISSLMFTTGITAAYNSILGPVFLDLSYINDVINCQSFLVLVCVLILLNGFLMNFQRSLLDVCYGVTGART